MESAPDNADDIGRPVGKHDSASLPTLRAEFPDFRIWRETIGDRVRYIGRSLDLGIGPHTVITADLGELRAVLADAPKQRTTRRAGPTHDGPPAWPAPG